MDLFSIVTMLLLLAVVSFLVYLIITHIPMPEPFKQVIVVACVILIVLYLLGLATGNVSPVRLR
jgi:hypothetical protein